MNLDPLLNANLGRLLLLLRTFLFDNSIVTMIEDLNSRCLEKTKSYQLVLLQRLLTIIKNNSCTQQANWNHTDLRT